MRGHPGARPARLQRLRRFHCLVLTVVLAAGIAAYPITVTLAGGTTRGGSLRKALRSLP
jgi:hypothetical protein